MSGPVFSLPKKGARSLVPAGMRPFATSAACFRQWTTVSGCGFCSTALASKHNAPGHNAQSTVTPGCSSPKKPQDGPAIPTTKTMIACRDPRKQVRCRYPSRALGMPLIPLGKRRDRQSQTRHRRPLGRAGLYTQWRTVLWSGPCRYAAVAAGERRFAAC